MLRSSLFLGRRSFSRGSLATPPAPFLTLPKTAAIVGAPFNLGQPLLGVEAGPNAVRQVRRWHVQTACGGASDALIRSPDFCTRTLDLILLDNKPIRTRTLSHTHILSLTQADLKQKITNEGWRFLDTGDLAFPPLVATAPRATAPDLNLNLVDEVGAACRTISDAVYKQASEV